MQQYLIVRKYRKYSLIDTLPIEMDISFRGEYSRIKIGRDNKVYRISKVEVVDDWFADIGHVTHYETHKHYLGTLIEQSDDIENIALTFAELVKEA